MRLAVVIVAAVIAALYATVQPAAAKLDACAAVSEADAARMLNAPSAASRSLAPSTNPSSTDAALIKGAADYSICSYAGPNGPKDAELRVILVKYESPQAAAAVADATRTSMTAHKIPGWIMASGVEHGVQVDWYVVGTVSRYSAASATAFAGLGGASVFITGGSTPPGQIKALAIKLAKSAQ